MTSRGHKTAQDFGFGGDWWKGTGGPGGGDIEYPRNIDEAKEQLLEYLHDEYVANIIEVNAEMIRKDPEWDPFFTFEDAQIDDYSFMNSFMDSRPWVGKEGQDAWGLMMEAYKELQGTELWKAGVDNFNDVMKHMMEEANIPMEKAPSAEELGQMFKFEALKLAAQLWSKGFHKEARLVRKIAQHAEPCPWCQMKRPGEKPNMVPVKVPGSHGMCSECFEIMKAEIEEKQRQK